MPFLLILENACLYSIIKRIERLMRMNKLLILVSRAALFLTGPATAVDTQKLFPRRSDLLPNANLLLTQAGCSVSGGIMRL